MTRDTHQTTGKGDGHLDVAPYVTGLAQPIVNLYFVGVPGGGDRNWVLVDAGLPGTAEQIARAAAARFGEGTRPGAIVLTHGHFDHVGALQTLAERWDVPVYAHPLELPYLTGRASYPPGDATVGGGGMAMMAPLYPRGPIDLGERVHPLPADGSVPGLYGWRAIHTPGHSPGHVSLWRAADGVLIAGDAFVTTKQESAIAALTKPVKLQGPPKYFTPDWGASRHSVEQLAALRPAVAATGHGKPMAGAELTAALEMLARDFDRRAVPKRGRYVRQPAVMDEGGVVSVPPAPRRILPLLLAVGAAGGIAFATVRRRVSKEMPPAPSGETTAMTGGEITLTSHETTPASHETTPPRLEDTATNSGKITLTSHETTPIRVEGTPLSSGKIIVKSSGSHSTGDEGTTPARPPTTLASDEGTLTSGESRATGNEGTVRSDETTRTSSEGTPTDREERRPPPAM